MTKTRALSAIGLFLACSGPASAQVVFLSDVLPYWAPFVVEPAPILHQPLPVALPQPVAAVPAQQQGEVRQYPPAAQRPQTQRVIHERHYLKPSQNVSNYLSAKPAQDYGPETMLVIREFFIDDEPVKKSEAVTPPPVGNKDDGMKAVRNDGAPKNSSDAGGFPDDKASTGVTAPNPAAADPNGRRSPPPPLGESNDPANREFYGPPAPPRPSDSNAAFVVSSRGGTPMADMELNFVDLAGTNTDVKGRTDGKGEFKTNLPPSRWQVYLVFGDNERKSLGVILVKPTPGEPFKLQF
jgi:hypothetical protein